MNAQAKTDEWVPDLETAAVLQRRSIVLLVAILGVSGLGFLFDLAAGGPTAGRVMLVDLAFIVVLSGVLGALWRLGVGMRTAPASALASGVVIVAGSLAWMARGELHLAVMITTSMLVVSGAFLPWGWRMQLVPVAASLLGIWVMKGLAEAPVVPVQSVALVLSCGVVSIVFASYLQRVRRAVAERNEEIAATHREVERRNQDLEQRVLRREGILRAANQRLEAFCQDLVDELTPQISSSRQVLGDIRAGIASEGGPDVHGLVDRTGAAIEQMDGTLAALVDYVALGRRSVARGRVDISSLATEHLARLRADGAGRVVEVVVESGIGVVGDEVLLGEALGHLIDNAWKFSAGREPARIEIGSRRGPEGEVEIYVRDNGVGFDMDHAAKLFRPFSRLEAVEAFPGHGMGLARVATIVRLHGGRTRAVGEEGERAEFSMLLPC